MSPSGLAEFSLSVTASLLRLLQGFIVFSAATFPSFHGAIHRRVVRVDDNFIVSATSTLRRVLVVVLVFH